MQETDLELTFRIPIEGHFKQAYDNLTEMKYKFHQYRFEQF